MSGGQLLTITTFDQGDVDDFLEGPVAQDEVLYFTAPWCAPCKRLSPALEKIAADNPEIEFLKIDIEEGENAKLASHFDVVSVPTLILMHQGERGDTITGAQSGRAILKWLGLM